MNLLAKLKKDFNLSYLFITHDLSVVEHVSDRIATMYLGEIAEVAATDEFYANPLHPYTIALLSANFVPDPRKRKNELSTRVFILRSSIKGRAVWHRSS